MATALFAGAIRCHSEQDLHQEDVGFDSGPTALVLGSSTQYKTEPSLVPSCLINEGVISHSIGLL